MGAAGRQQGPPPQLLPRGRQAVLLQPGPPRARRADRPRGGVHRHLVGRRRVPRLPAAALGVRGLDAARCGGGLPQGRRPDRRDGRHLPGRARRRGGRRLRGADLLAAAGGRPGRPGDVVRAARGVRRRRPAQRHPVLRPRASHPAWTLHARRPRRGAARLGRAVRPDHPGHARALGVPRRGRGRAASRRDRVRLRRHDDPALPVRRDGARARRLHRARRLGVAGPRLARRGPGRPARPLDDRPHGLPGHRPPDGPGRAATAQEAPAGAGRLRPRLHRSAAARRSDDPAED